jgi:hypothetical protein
MGWVYVFILQLPRVPSASFLQLHLSLASPLGILGSIGLTLKQLTYILYILG